MIKNYCDMKLFLIVALKIKKISVSEVEPMSVYGRVKVSPDDRLEIICVQFCRTVKAFVSL